LKDLGITSPTQEFQSILSGVMAKQEMDEDFNGDPYELALKLFSEKHPGRVIYTMPRSDRASKVFFRQNELVKDWIIGNRSIINKYGTDASLFFAPQMADYQKGASKWFRQEGFTEGLDYETFLNRAQVVSLKDEYFRLGKAKEERLRSEPNEDERRRIAAVYETMRRDLKESSPLLMQALENPSVADELVIYGNVKQLAMDEKFPMNPTTRSRLVKMINVFDRAYNAVTMPEQDYEVDFVERKAMARRSAETELGQLSKGDPSLSMFNRIILTEILSMYSRDRVTVRAQSSKFGE
jgi:hypothetical protein